MIISDTTGVHAYVTELNEGRHHPDVEATLEDGRPVRVPTKLLRNLGGGRYELAIPFAQLLPGDRGSLTVPLAEESLSVAKRRTESTVRIRKTVEEHQAIVEQPVTVEHADIERVPINRPVSGPVAARQEGDTLIIPLVEEEIVTQKRLVLREEIRITRRQSREQRTQQVALKREDAVVERSDLRDRASDQGD